MAKGKTVKPCSDADARTRLDDAVSRLEAGENFADENSPSADIRTAISNFIESAISSSDAACCKALGERNAGQNHDEAVALLKTVTPGGAQAAKNLQALLGIKSGIQYGFISGTPDRYTRSLRQAKALLKFAEETLGR